MKKLKNDIRQSLSYLNMSYKGVTDEWTTTRQLLIGNANTLDYIERELNNMSRMYLNEQAFKQVYGKRYSQIKHELTEIERESKMYVNKLKEIWKGG